MKCQYLLQLTCVVSAIAYVIISHSVHAVCHVASLLIRTTVSYRDARRILQYEWSRIFMLQTRLIINNNNIKYNGMMPLIDLVPDDTRLILDILIRMHIKFPRLDKKIYTILTNLCSNSARNP